MKMKFTLSILALFLSLSCFSQADPPPPAIYDSISVLQPNSDTINVFANDTGYDVDSLCISFIYGSPAFSIVSCTGVFYHPDSSFVGNDTCWLVVCDTANRGLCDTSVLVVTSLANGALLPVANFINDSIYNYPNNLFACSNDLSAYNYYVIKNTSLNSDSFLWVFSPKDSYFSCQDSVRQSDTDSLMFNFTEIFPFESDCGEPDSVSVCLTAFNKFGSNTTCAIICHVLWEGITEVPLFGINIYPNPANNILVINMEQNTDAITNDYAAIEIYNSIGERAQAIPRGGQQKLLNIPISGLAGGIYMAAIMDNKGVIRTLGKFSIIR